MGGGSYNLYTLCLMWIARKQGYKVGTILFRGAQGLPFTSGKITYGGAWRDAKSIIDHVHKTYIKKAKQEGRRGRLYVYGCSLGAQILGLYLRKEGYKACDVVDGAVFYGTPWSPVQTSDYFYNNMFGFYQLVIGSNLSKETYRILP